MIASALSIQDPRERPQDKREQANEFHNRFKVEGSDLLSLVALLRLFHTVRYLRPGQILGRVAFRLRHVRLNSQPAPARRSPAGWFSPPA